MDGGGLYDSAITILLRNISLDEGVLKRQDACEVDNLRRDSKDREIFPYAVVLYRQNGDFFALVENSIPIVTREKRVG